MAASDYDYERWRRYDEESKLAQTFVCGCRGRGSCIVTQHLDYIIDTRHYCEAMTAAEREFFIFGLLYTQWGRGKRSMPYWVEGIKVCRKMFEFVHCLDHKTLTDINKKFKERFVPISP